MADVSKARLRLWLRLLKAQRRIEGELREKLRAEYSSTLPRFDVLAALDRNRDGLRMSELSGDLKVSNGNVTGIVERLVEDGLVTRTPVAQDRRAMKVQLTAEGISYFATLAEAHEAWVSELLQSFDAEGAEQLSDTLDQLNISLESHND
ncbi:MarR family winged helix-turn-helix transcriptional regulator [Cochlodiniinecator piscidefendens]|uniref:MarR family winged helix-turn-helix transcriptional regulator n=1 Tax=Cochlodiniinecator piscidefendens TaxID=2715756 RepID=UPI00197C4295|nr:MarR family transcriptional regulator [Cochlodiniinecator piscidefendens]